MSRDDFWDDLGKFYDPLGLDDFNGDGHYDMLEALEAESDFWAGCEDFERKDISFDDYDDFETYSYSGRKIAAPIVKQETPVVSKVLQKSEEDSILELMPADRKDVIVKQYRKTLLTAIIIGIVISIVGGVLIRSSVGNDGYIIDESKVPVFGFGIVILILGTILSVAPGILIFALYPNDIVKKEIANMKRLYEIDLESGHIKNEKAKEYAKLLEIVNKDRGFERLETE